MRKVLFPVLFLPLAMQLTWACQCSWNGPFLTVSCQSPLVVHGRILGYTEKKQETPPFLEVEVIEVLTGKTTDARLRVDGDNGMLCRADVSRFPPGSEWILALDGPGSKPKMTGGHALSLCGEYWLRLQQGKVIGLIDAGIRSSPAREISLAEFRKRFSGKSCGDTLLFTGEITAGKAFLRYFGSGFTFHLQPVPSGWMISVTDERGTEDISRFTPPLHFVPNPREIEGWHFRNSDNTGPNEPGEKNVNAPGEVRTFCFSPEVGRTIGGDHAKSAPSQEEMQRVERYGQGLLTILDYRLGNLEPNRQARFEWMRFRVELTWAQKR